uniref:TIR-NBS type disease resistance protein n=1 Tax=Populus trichocarpa TaxID=3694 RepID=Q19PK8_POPTR|nr:TIR-NBS type disease resistance protein [Populus trichocarpa]
MAGGKYQESSSSRFSNCKHQVFLSFRGEDTRRKFTDHLYTALVQAGIHTFRDDDEIQRGHNIELEIQKAIQQSKISIIVFSIDYARSRWCLDELVMIMERKRTTNSIVLPVFYDVDPSQVRNQTGSFAAAFVEHEKRFKEEMERVNGWRIALKEVADLGGMVLGDGSHSAAIALLYGIGGVGKTAIAKNVYNQNFYKFEGKSFLSNFRERSKEFKGLVCLQRQLLSDILKKSVDEINDVDEGILKIKDVICCRRTLIVLDDVEERDQFNAIVGMQNWLCKGSKIIVTTRNKGLLSANDKWVKCKVEPLDNGKSLELFSWHAFGQAYPVEGFVEDSWKIVNHCNGLPLALRVIGSSLSGKSREVWESALHEMEVIPNCEVQKILRISYDSLDDEYQKNLFLDIACFFNGMDYNYAVRILDGLGIGARFRIDNLIDRCLVEIVEINSDKRLWMHQLVRDMGREISRQESPQCQRIWHHMEAFTVLKEASDAEKLRGLTIDMHALMEDNCTKAICGDSMVRHKHNFFQHYRLPTFPSREWLSDLFFGEQVQSGQASLLPVLSTDALRKMQNVKFLQLNYLKFHGSYEHFPKNLVTVFKGVFNVVVADEDGMFKFYEEEEEEWIIQKEFVGCLSFQIASPAAHRICGFNLFTSGYKHGNAVLQSLSHWKLGGDDPTFDNGDDVSISVLPLDPTIQIMMVGVLWLHEEEGNGDDDDIQSKNKVITSQRKLSQPTTVADDDDDDDVHLANVETACHIFRNYSCAARYNPGNLEVCSWLFEKKVWVLDWKAATHQLFGYIVALMPYSRFSSFG